MSMTIEQWEPPFPYFGGKSQVASVVWDALGDVPCFVEPFFGSGAVLFLRPHSAKIETVNDADSFVSNFWRAVQSAPEKVADYADWIVSEPDLHSRHLWLVNKRESLTDRLCGDPDYFDAKIAGWWVWGLCAWIGSGFCSGNGPWITVDGRMVKSEDHEGIEAGKGVRRKRPNLGNNGQGVNRQRPHLGESDLGECALRRQWLRRYLTRFADRLRNVRVCCGDWARVCTPCVTTKHGLTGLFIDPPYADTAGRESNLYTVDSLQVAHDAKKFAVAHGDDPSYRIVFAGYDGEHEFPPSWRVHRWKTKGGMANTSVDKNSNSNKNRHRECLFISPHCLSDSKTPLFDVPEEVVNDTIS